MRKPMKHTVKLGQVYAGHDTCTIKKVITSFQYTATTELLFQTFLMVTSVASFIEKISIFLDI